MSIKRVGVVGAGQMGAGIAQVAATCGLEVFIYDSFSGAEKKATESFQKSLTKLKEKGILTENVDNVLKRLTFVKTLKDFETQKVDIVIEAIKEDFALKSELFKELDACLSAHVILATNTSSISITKLAAITKRPEKFIGMHFMNPVPLMKLVEVIRGLATSNETCTEVKNLALKMDKTPVEAQDRAGFVVNRILMPMINEAIFALDEKLATATDIDNAMKLGTNQPMGPLELADFVGLDTCLYIMDVLFDAFHDTKFRAAPLLRQYVDAGWLGRKTKRGFYKY